MYVRVLKGTATRLLLKARCRRFALHTRNTGRTSCRYSAESPSGVPLDFSSRTKSLFSAVEGVRNVNRRFRWRARSCVSPGHYHVTRGFNDKRVRNGPNVFPPPELFSAWNKKPPVQEKFFYGHPATEPLTLEREVRAGYADFVRVVLNDRARLGHDGLFRVHRPNSEVTFHTTGHQVTRVRAERNARDVFVIAAQFPIRRQTTPFSSPLRSRPRMKGGMEIVRHEIGLVIIDTLRFPS